MVTADGAVVHNYVCKIAAKRGRNHVRSQEFQAEEKRKSTEKDRVAVRTPGPEGDGVPLFNLEALALLATAAGAGGGGWGRRHGDAALVHREQRSNPRITKDGGGEERRRHFPRWM